VYQRIEERVTALYIEQNISKVPINPFDIADKRGYIVKPFSDLNRQARPLTTEEYKKYRKFFRGIK
jgi:hypothetical protein